MSIFINILCFSAGSVFGVVMMSLFAVAGRSDEQAGMK